jgi:hypothetical protein
MKLLYSVLFGLICGKDALYYQCVLALSTFIEFASSQVFDRAAQISYVFTILTWFSLRIEIFSFKSENIFRISDVWVSLQ